MYNGKAIIKLMEDIDVHASLRVARKVTIDMNGEKLYNTSEIWNSAINDWSIISVMSNGELTIKGEGIVEALETIAMLYLLEMVVN